MIVVDTNIIVYQLLDDVQSQYTEAVFHKDPHWVVPLLWRSEFRNVLAGYLRKKIITLKQACELIEDAEELFNEREYQVSSQGILKLVADSPCSAYDCEFVQLALDLNVSLVTADKVILNAFPALSFSPKTFIEM